MRRHMRCGETLRAASAVIAIASAGAAPAAAQSQNLGPGLTLRSLAAGYKAAFTCSAHFNAGRSIEQIAGDELNRIYPDYREAIASVGPAEIDEQNRAVSVSYAEGMPPRMSVWRPFFGCAQLPTGADSKAAGDLPRIKGLKPPREAPPLPTDFSDDVALANTVAAAFDRRTYGEGTETTAILIVRDGAIIAEEYRDGFDADTPQRTWSVAKSIAATIIGVAAHKGLIDVDEPAGLEAWDRPGDPRAAIAVDDLLRMSSGLTSATAGNRTDDVYFGGGRIIDHAVTNRLVAAPGGVWRYANNDTMTAMRALRERMRGDNRYWRFPFEAVLHRIGMTRTFLETDWNGDFVLSSQVWTTARDLARLGLLYLDDGVWEEERILPAGWSAYVSAPTGPQPEPRRPGENRPGYGAQFWLFGERHGLPEGTYAAMGNRGQYLFIVPETRTLIIRRGFDDNGGARFDIARFAADALAALDGAPDADAVDAAREAR